jgi:hypothetical protein
MGASCEGWLAIVATSSLVIYAFSPWYDCVSRLCLCLRAHACVVVCLFAVQSAFSCVLCPIGALTRHRCAILTAATLHLESPLSLRLAVDPAAASCLARKRTSSASLGK